MSPSVFGETPFCAISATFRFFLTFSTFCRITDIQAETCQRKKNGRSYLDADSAHRKYPFSNRTQVSICKRHARSDRVNSPPANRKPKSPPENVEETFRDYDRALHRFLLQRLRSRENTEDVAQEIYLRMLRFGNPELVREPRAYLYRIARNVLHDKRLLEDREPIIYDSQIAEYCSEHSQNDADEHGASPHLSSVDGRIEPPEAAEDQAAQIDNDRRLQHILSQLPPMYRAVLVLRKGEGLSYVEIAKELNLSIHTVKKYMRLSLAQCRLISLGLAGSR